MSKKTKANDELNILKKSPIYAMSLGNHELFHTNFWAWMMEKDHKIIEKLFEVGMDSSKEIQVNRESHHTDICIVQGENVYVIENKFKSIPQKSQLESYTKEFDKKNYFKGLLISPFKPDFKADNWEWKGYSDIIATIKNRLKDSPVPFDTFEQELINAYCDFSEQITKILKKEIRCEELKLGFDFYEDFDEIRLGAILRKLNAQSFVDYLKQAVAEDCELKSLDNLYIDVDYAPKGKSAIVNAFIIIPIKDDFRKDDLYLINKKAEYKLMIGIQIQGNKYCRAVSRSISEDRSNASELFEDFKGKWFDEDFKKAEKEISFRNKSKLPTSMSPGNKEYDPINGLKYDIYNTSINRFIYQFFNLYESSSFGTVKELLIKDLKDAIEIVKQKRYKLKRTEI